MPGVDLLPPSHDISQVGPGFDNTIGGNYGHMIMPTTHQYILNRPGEHVAPSPSTTWDDGNPYNSENMPGMQEVIDDFGLHDYYDQANTSGGTTGYEKDDSQVHDNEATGASLAEYLQQNPGASYMDALQYMAKYSDEWAEKYIDYIAEQEGLDKANAYTAQREDTAYQRLVHDLEAAGLNPAMMYGSSASPLGPSGSQGYVKTTEGATSRGISNYKKIQDLLLAYLGYELKKNLGIVSSVTDGVNALFNAIGKFLPTESISHIFKGI